MIMAPKEMVRSVSQLLFSYLPDRTVSWEDGAGVVRLGTPRIEAAWPESRAQFVLQEIGEYLRRWAHRSGVVDARFPPAGSTERFTVGTPLGISASLLETAFYCRDCFRFIPKLRTGDTRYECPDCRRQTLRQVSYVFVHGCGELTPIGDSMPQESTRKPGSIYWAPIRCMHCPDGGLLRLDARSERLSALRVYCARCNAEVIQRPLARCPYCLPRLTGTGGQLAFRTAMRITRHSANNAYYPHLTTVLRLDRPRAVQDSPDLAWLQGLLPRDERAPSGGVSTTLVDLVAKLTAAEQRGDAAAAERLRREIAAAASARTETQVERVAHRPSALLPDVLQSVRESVALLSTVHRIDVASLHGGNGASHSGDLFQRLGISRMEVVEDLPVITAVFGYSRRSPDPQYLEERAAEPFPTTLRPFPTLDEDAARVLGRPQAVGTVPILAREGLHEGLAIYLEPKAVLEWLKANGAALSSGNDRARLTSILEGLEPVQKYYDDIWNHRLRRLLFGLLHSVSHCAMKALSRTAGLEETSISEYMFPPLLGCVVFGTSSMPLGGVRTTARDRLLEFLDAMYEEARRCVYDPDCLQRQGACHSCIHVPEIGCRVFNHGLSRAFLVGGHAPWVPTSDRTQVVGYWATTQTVSR